MTVLGQDPIAAPLSFDIESLLKRTQAIAGALFAVFVLLHLSNIFVAPFGPDIFNQYQSLLRIYYQNPAVELLLVIGPLVVHMIAGVWLAAVRKSRGQRPLMQRVHTWAGVFLFVVILGHVMAVRGPSLFYGVYPEFEGLNFSLWYFPAYFYPYYFLLALAGFYHATNGLRMFAARRGFIMTGKTHTTISLLTGAWIILSLLAIGGVLIEVPTSPENPFGQLIGELTGFDVNNPIRF